MVTAQTGAILQILQDTLAVPSLVKSKSDPFETLIVTIISQNTADRNTAVAFERLSKRFEITPEALAKADPAQIEECIKVAGLYKGKTKAIQTASKIVLKNSAAPSNPFSRCRLKKQEKRSPKSRALDQKPPMWCCFSLHKSQPSQ